MSKSLDSALDETCQSHSLQDQSHVQEQTNQSHSLEDHQLKEISSSSIGLTRTEDELKMFGDIISASNDSTKCGTSYNTDDTGTQISLLNEEPLDLSNYSNQSINNIQKTSISQLSSPTGPVLSDSGMYFGTLHRTSRDGMDRNSSPLSSLQGIDYSRRTRQMSNSLYETDNSIISLTRRLSNCLQATNSSTSMFRQMSNNLNGTDYSKSITRQISFTPQETNIPSTSPWHKQTIEGINSTRISSQKTHFQHGSDQSASYSNGAAGNGVKFGTKLSLDVPAASSRFLFEGNFTVDAPNSSGDVEETEDLMLASSTRLPTSDSQDSQGFTRGTIGCSQFRGLTTFGSKPSIFGREIRPYSNMHASSPICPIDQSQHITSCPGFGMSR